jgi:hypothetical protein
LTTAAAHRAAGQAVAAVIEGAPIADLSIDGVEIVWPDDPTGKRRRSELLADVAIGLAGIAAEIRLRFGRISSADCVVRNCFTSGQIKDFSEVHELVAEIDPTGTDDVFLQAWRQAVDLVVDRASWDAIAALAIALQHGEISGSDIARIVNRVRAA